LILDEPAASLDEDGQAWLLNFLQQIKAEKKTLILATHQKELVDAIADQTIQMNKLHQLVK
jgi:cobalt/nickel transport system ATP-binding protein